MNSSIEAPDPTSYIGDYLALLKISTLVELAISLFDAAVLMVRLTFLVFSTENE